MNDLIDRQAAIDALACLDDYEEEAIEALRKLPSAQPGIIRCAECKWFQCNMRMDGYLPKGVDEFECRHWCGSCDPVDFCSHAERRADE